MSNATVSSQVYILRTHASLSAVNAGTMVLYSDDQHVFAQDQAGNIYNLCTPNVSNLSISLGDLDDTNITSLTTDITNKIHILRYDAQTSVWVNENLELNLGQLNNVLDATPNDGDALVYQASTQSFVYASIGSGTSDNLGDHTATEPLKMGQHAIEGHSLEFKDTDDTTGTANFHFIGKNVTSLTPIHQPAKLVLYSSDGSASNKYVSVQAQEAGSMGTSYNVRLPSSAPTANQVLAAESSIADATDVTLVWTAPTAGIGLTDLEVITSGSTTPGGSLTYNDASGDFTYTPASTSSLQNWTEDSSGHIVPNTTELHSLGSADNKIKNIWLSDGQAGKLYFDATGSANANTTSDFGYIGTSGDASGRLEFKAHNDTVTGTNLYDFRGDDAHPARLVMHTGAGAGIMLSIQGNENATSNQILRFPSIIGTVGSSLAVNSITGTSSDELNLKWTVPSSGRLGMSGHPCYLMRGVNFGSDATDGVIIPIIKERAHVASTGMVMGNSNTTSAATLQFYSTFPLAPCSSSRTLTLGDLNIMLLSLVSTSFEIPVSNTFDWEAYIKVENDSGSFTAYTASGTGAAFTHNGAVGSYTIPSSSFSSSSITLASDDISVMLQLNIYNFSSSVTFTKDLVVRLLDMPVTVI